MNLSAFLGLAQQIVEDEDNKLKVKAAPASEQTKKAEEKTEVSSVTPPKGVDYVKKRPTEVDPEKIHNLPEVPKSVEAMVKESVLLKQRKADLQADVQMMLENAGAPAIDKRLAQIPLEIAEELKKFPEQACLLEDLVIATFTRTGAIEGKLTKEEEKLVASLTARIKAANASIARSKEKIAKLNEEAFSKRGGKKSTSEHVQYFPDPDKRHPRGEGSAILTEPIKPKVPAPAPAPAVPATAAGMLEQLNILRGVELNAKQQKRLQKIEAGIIEVFRAALASVKDMIKSLAGVDKDIDKLISSFKKEPASAKA